MVNKKNKIRWILMILLITLGIVAFYINKDIKDYQKDFPKPTIMCPQKECEINLCQPLNQLQLNHISVYCVLNPLICSCEVYNYDAFYQGLGRNEEFFNPSANMYKSYSVVLDTVNKKMEEMPSRLKVNFIEGRMQYYYKGTINVWPRDKYGQYHELIHFLIRSYTQPQEGWYPNIEEGVAHYGAYCYNHPNTARCDYTLGDYEEKNICIPNEGICKGQRMATSLVLELRKDYQCDWNHCWKEFLNWVVYDMQGKPLNLRDAILELNNITGNDTNILMLKYGLDITTGKEIPTFSIYYDDSVIEEEIINENGEFTTL